MIEVYKHLATAATATIVIMLNSCLALQVPATDHNSKCFKHESDSGDHLVYSLIQKYDASDFIFQILLSLPHH